MRPATPFARLALTAALLLAAIPRPAAAQDRPSEEDLFGTSTPAPTATSAPEPTDARAADLLGRDHEAPEGRIGKEQNDPLALGGQLYLRGATSWTRGSAAADWPLTSPNLLDAYLDARPNDRVRAFALGRLFYDPTVATQGLDLLGNAVARSQTRAVLDQLYVNFDLDRTVFVTAGKQHVKWGTGKFWNPGDWLHPVRRDPLAQFDDRTGVAMVKAHLPWEKHGWNFYGVALLEDVTGTSAASGTTALTGSSRTLGKVGGGARAEVVLGPAELGADVVAQGGHRPRFGFDGSFPLLDADVHAELALRQGKDAPRWRLRPGADPKLLASYERDEWSRVTPAVVVGAEWSINYSDEDAVTLGAEYFYDDAGYRSARIYPVLIASPFVPRADGTLDGRAAFTPFYLGRQYAGAYVALPRPGRWNDTTITLSVIANLSDGSAIARLDHVVVLNTYLTLESYVAGHLGHEGGELRFGLDVAAQPPFTTAAVVVPAPVLDLGVAVRVKL
ncbi:MAG TPA: hypothetical protein VFP50_18050 [Anaeromyxobacteraceae bacterium]|nr:hypothetical protein [Anaeromyxobacteraceae bacterium]